MLLKVENGEEKTREQNAPKHNHPPVRQERKDLGLGIFFLEGEDPVMSGLPSCGRGATHAVTSAVLPPLQHLCMLQHATSAAFVTAISPPREKNSPHSASSMSFSASYSFR